MDLTDRLRQIVRHPKLRRFWTTWRILMWKAVLMRLDSPISIILEIVIAIVFSLQIRLIFEPTLYPQDLEQHSRDDILRKLPDDVQCWYAPKHVFLDELMSKAAKMLRKNIQAADSEINLVHSRYTRNDTSKVLWAIFEVDKFRSGNPKVLQYKIRSSEIGENRIIMMHEEESFYEDPYVLSGFMALQIAIENSFIELWTDPTLPKIADNLTISRFPIYKMDVLLLPSVVRHNISVIYYMMVVAFFLLPVATLRKVLHDKETGFRGLMKLTNMSYAMLYVGWLSYLMISVLPVTIICTILLNPVFTATNALVTAIFIIMYTILSAVFMFTIGTFFNHTTKALLTSILFWLFLTHLTIVLDHFLMTGSILSKIGSLILPHGGLLYGLIAFTTRTDFSNYEKEDLRNMLQKVKLRVYSNSGSYLWSRWLSDVITLRDVHDIIHAREQISIGMILFAWSLHIIFWFLLAVYLDNINPGKFGSAKPWYYLCKKPVYIDEELMIQGSTNWSAVESTPSYIMPCIRVRCVTKEFGRRYLGECVTAVDNITIDFYNQEFTVILGHNGAGKSCLLKIITDMYKPTYGHVYLERKNHDRNDIELVGYCPQSNILVNYLTTMQHLYMFGMMKGMRYVDAHRESLKLLNKLDLESVKNTKVKACSFSTQRRICLAMALIGNTKILVLDEPMHGLDPEHKRQVWDLLSDVKREKTILMVTNSMEAADLLADRIMIIANGKVECYGSKMYLNRRYGIGYVLSLLVQEGCNVERVRAEIQEFSSDPITLRGMMGMVIKFDVPRSSRFTKLLRHLESNKEELGIVSVALSAASIEGQFLRIGLESQFKERCVKLSSDKYELIVQKRRRHLLRTAKQWKRLTGNALWRQQILAMLYKKLLHIISAWKVYMFSMTLAIVTLTLTTMIGELSSFALFDGIETVMNLTKYTDNNLHVLYHAADDKSAEDFLITLYTTGQAYSERQNYHVSKHITAIDIMTHPDLHSIEFRDRYVMSVDVYADGHVQLMHSPTAMHSGPIALNLLHNALLRYHCGSDCWIELTSRPLVNPQQWQHLLAHPRSVRNWENAAIVITLFLLLPSVDMGIREQNTLSKLLQTNAIGMTTQIYWFTMYIIDFSLYALGIIVLGIVIVIAYRHILHSSALEVVQVLVIFLCYGGYAIPLGYCIQLFTRKSENVYLVMVLINVIVVLLVNSSVIFPLMLRVFTGTGRYIVEALIHIFPPYVLVCALSNYIMLSVYNRQCSYFNTCDTEFYIEDPCCQHNDERYYKQINVMLIKQSGSEYYHSVTDDILLMISQMIVLLIILNIFETKNRRRWYDYSMFPVKTDDIVEPEVVKERKQVEEHIKHYDETKMLPQQVALVVQNLRKEYNGKAVVRGVSFNIFNQECFGLLGFNGAGKSTIYNMLTSRTKITAGRAVLYEYEFKEQDTVSVSAIGMIGYCPQTDGLSDFMTGRQNLQLHAALRGVPHQCINEEVDKWLDVLDMLDYENLKISHCPWGIQRKLCVLQSLIGDLPMIFMDEPTSGIDIMTRHALCEVLRQMCDMGRSILITTHSMPEAEAMCLRVGILSNGQFTAIGCCEDLKARHGRNFILIIKIIPGFQLAHLEKIKKIIDDTFPDIKFKDSYLGVLKYELESDISHSFVFDKLEKLRQKYVWITDFSVTQPSMDEVFLTLAKTHKDYSKKLTLYERLRLFIVHVCTIIRRK